ncbi:MAG: sigma-E factor negative regulatory protein [Gammaproteobacteria bacterium]|nr:sigma-E factor negative regulatory protein [Gammaproteobacteria bacterium]
MSEKLRESLSATIDDEADEFELRRVLDEMEKDDRLRVIWERYHLIGALMRREGEQARDVANLRDRVWAELELERSESLPDSQEPDPGATADDGASPRFGRSVGLAVAATVAFAVVLGIGSLNTDDQDAPALAVNTVNPVIIEGPQLQEIQLKQEVSASDVQRANAYMMHHVQQQALNQPGVASFVKLVTYER